MLNKFIAIILCLQVSPIWAALTLVQHVASDTAASGTTATATITANRGGSMIVVGSVTGATTILTVLKVTDNAPGGSNQYYPTGAFTSDATNALTTDVWYAPICKPGATTITVTYNGGATTNNRDVFAFEVAGFQNPTVGDAQVTALKTGAGTDTGATARTIGSTGFIIGVVTTFQTVTANPAVGNSFTAGGDISAIGQAACSKIFEGLGVHTPQWTDANGAVYITSVVSFTENVIQPSIPFGGF